MHTVQYLLAGNMNIRPYMHTVQNLLTGNCYVRPYTHFVQHILTEMRNFRPYLLTGNGMLDLIHTHYRICWQKKGLCYIRVSLHYAVCTNICAGKGQLKKLLASYCGSLWEKTTVERERKKVVEGEKVTESVAAWNIVFLTRLLMHNPRMTHADKLWKVAM